jgi:hypothetical protein
MIEAWVTGRVDPSQRMNKSSYYHSFKTQFKSRTSASPRSQMELIVNPCQYKKKKVVIIIVLKLDSMVDLR